MIAPDAVGVAVEAYRHMLRARRWSDGVVALHRQGRIGPFTPLDGHEAAIVGAAIALGERDWIFPQYREGLALASREPRMLLSTIQWLRGHPDAERPGDESRIYTRQTAVAAQIPHAVGMAWGLQRRKEAAVVLCFFGDGATSQGDFYEAMNLAGVVGAPVVLLCINNGWAISTPLRRQTAVARLADKATAAGITGVTVDGTDPSAVAATVGAARERALAGEGPTLVEALAPRLCAHTTSDDPARYMDADEMASWSRRDPVVLLRNSLVQQGVWTDDEQRAAEEDADRDFAAAVAQAEATPLDPAAWFDHVYETIPPMLAAQREELLAVLRSGAEDDG